MLTSVFRITAIALALLAVLWGSLEVYERVQNFDDRSAFRECVSLAMSRSTRMTMDEARARCEIQHSVSAEYLGRYPTVSTETIRLAAISRPSFIFN
jgi:hypothetical protein